MLIATKWRNCIVNLDNVEMIFEEREATQCNPGYKILARTTSGKNVMLGVYNDEARVKEILGEIARGYVMALSDRPAYIMPDE